jgi:ABC-type antimicrobial peptide transport system, permease component
MILHYLKTALRNILKHKTQTVVCILGITAGILCFSICAYYVRALYRGDSEFPRYKEMAVLQMKYSGDVEYRHPTSEATKVFHEQFAQDIELLACMEESTREYNIRVEHNGVERIVRINTQACNSDFVVVYPPELVMGSIDAFRNNPNSVIITEELSKKLFGKESPLGKTLYAESVAYRNIGAPVTFTVTGVMKPYLPYVFDGVFAPEMLHNNNGVEGYGGDSYTYVLKPDVNVGNLNNRLSTFEFKDDAKAMLLYKNDLRKIVPAAFFVSLIGLFVLLAGLLNFLNTTIGAFANRTAELSLRKMLGAFRYQQFFLLFMELLIILSASFFLCMILTETLIPYIISNMPTDISRELSIDLTELFGQQIMNFVYILLFCSIVAFIGAFRIKDRQRISRHRVRNFLLGVQFFICMMFILATGATYLVSKNTLKTNAPYLEEAKMEHIFSIRFGKERIILEKYLPEIKQFINSSSLFEKYAFLLEDLYKIENLKNTSGYNGSLIRYVSPDFFDIMNFPSNSSINEEQPYCFINEALDERLKADSTDYIQIEGNTYPVVKVVNSTEKGWIKDVAYIPAKEGVKVDYIYVQAKRGKSKEALSALQEKIQSYLPEYNDFRIYSLKESNLSNGQDILQRLFMICSMICIMITILGLYGAITIDTERRQKEVAIRKINGAGVKHIYWMFGKSYLWLFVITAIIIFISGLFVMNMLSMALRIFFDYTNPFYWILSFLSVAIVIICTIVYRIYAISRINPAEIIKSE